MGPSVVGVVGVGAEMQLVAEVAAPDASAVVALLHRPAQWHWLGGALEPVSSDELVVSFETPRPVWLHLKMSHRTDGVDIALVQGDVTHLQGAVVVADGCVRADLDVVFASTIPGVLLTELQSEVLPRWLQGLVAQVDQTT